MTRRVASLSSSVTAAGSVNRCYICDRCMEIMRHIDNVPHWIVFHGLVDESSNDALPKRLIKNQFSAAATNHSWTGFPGPGPREMAVVYS